MKKSHKCTVKDDKNIEKATNCFTEDSFIDQEKSIIKLNPLQP